MIRPSFIVGPCARQLAVCAGVAVAALAATSAHATVVNVNFSSNAFSTIPFNVDGVYLNVVTGATGTSGAGVAGYDLNPYYSGPTTATPLFRFFTPSTGGIVGSAAVATALAAGTTIGAASTFVNGVTNATQATAGTYYFGFKFLNEATSLTNYGYVTVSESAQPLAAGSVRLLAYSYENAGASITIPAVPEPSSYLMMALGLAGLGTWARRRRIDR